MEVELVPETATEEEQDYFDAVCECFSKWLRCGKQVTGSAEEVQEVVVAGQELQVSNAAGQELPVVVGCEEEVDVEQEAPVVGQEVLALGPEV